MALLSLGRRPRGFESYTNVAAFPAVGKTGTGYIALDTDVVYLWDTTTSAYIDLAASGDPPLLLTGGTLTGNLAFNGGYIKLDPLLAEPAHAEGNLYYDNEEKTLAYQSDINGVTVNVGQEMHTRVVNKTGAPILEGTVVYINGAQGNRPTIAKARADADATSLGVLGLTTHDILDNAEGLITTHGIVHELDTSSFTLGATLYLSAATAGALTATMPAAPNRVVSMGVVTVVHANQGHILVRVAQSSVNALQITDSTAAGRTLLTAADADAQKTALGLSASLTTTVDYWTRTAVVPASNGLSAIDGVTPAVGQPWLLTASGVNNGVWVAASGAWTRHPDYDTGAKIRGSVINARLATGSGLPAQEFFNTNAAAITLGVTAITYSPGVGFDASGNLNLNQWGAASALGVSLFANGGSTTRASLVAATGASGNLTLTNAGTGSFQLVVNATNQMTLAPAFSASTFCSAITTGSLAICEGLTSGTITVGRSQSSSTHTMLSGTAGLTPMWDFKSSQDAGMTGIRIWNGASGTAAGKYAAIAFGGDSTVFNGGQIRVNNTQAFGWNNASQLMEMVFAIGQGTTLTDVGKFDLRGRFVASKGFATGINYQAPATGASIALANTDSAVLIDPAGTLAALTVVLPVAPADGQRLMVVVTQAITSLTWNPVGPTSAAFSNTPAASSVAGQVFQFTYRSADNKWYHAPSSAHAHVAADISDSTATGRAILTGSQALVFTSVNAQTGTTYTTQATDHRGVVTLSNASPIAVTLSAIPANGIVMFENLGAGQVTFTAGAGNTLRHVAALNKIAGQWGRVLLRVAANGTDYILSGDMS